MEDGALPIVFDGHNDSILNVYVPERGGGRDFLVESPIGHLDLPRARRSGFGGGFFALFTPATLRPEEPGKAVGSDGRLPPAIDPAYAQRFTLSLAGSLFRLEEKASGALQVVRTADELQRCLEEGVLAVVLHIEGAEALDPELEALHVLYRAGLRSLGIVWSRPNAFGQGVPFRCPASPDIGPGLTEAGQRLVRACNELGVVVDVSHLNEKGFWDVAELTTEPLVATHSNAHAVAPSTRNLTDRQLDAVAESGGVVGVNFHVSFLREDGQRDVHTPLEQIVRHVDYLVERMGIDHVAFGSDFDGAAIPRDLKDVTGLPRLLALLGEQGYSAEDLKKIAHQNWIRLLRETWRPENHQVGE